MLLFTTGTITDVSVAAVGTAMQNKMRDDIVVHPAWDLVEEFTPASGLVNWVVLKCLASQSGLAQDYYVIIGRTISSGVLSMFICEGYNSATKTCSFFQPYWAAPVMTYDSLGRSSATFVLSTAVINNAPANNTTPWVRAQYSPGSTTAKWWIIVDNDGFSVAWNGNPNYFVHCGSYIPLSNPAVSALPISMHSLSSGGTGPDGGYTRNPAMAGVAGTQKCAFLAGYGGGSPVNAQYSPTLGWGHEPTINPLTADKLNGDKKGLISEIGVVIYPQTVTDISVSGYVLGKQRPRFRTLSIGSTIPAGILWGDTWTFNGTLWVQYLMTDSRLWDTGVGA